MSIFQLWEKGSDQTAQAQADHLWNLFVELRKELVESQKIRSQILGFKITFLTSLIVAISAVYASKGIGLLESQNSYLLQVFVGVLFLVPAFSAIFFDFIIYSYSFSVKRIGCYIREYIEPVMKAMKVVPDGFVLWEEYLEQPKTKQHYAQYGNIGLTTMTVIVASIPFYLKLSFAESLHMDYQIYGFLFCVLLLLLFDIYSFNAPQIFDKDYKNTFLFKIHFVKDIFKKFVGV
ncbi:MAG: hypothetical protein HGA97_11950 [Chlorobiaceae bacterium]|nr:hypothetical protein [Chlorobiaceae bacterium]